MDAHPPGRAALNPFGAGLRYRRVSVVACGVSAVYLGLVAVAVWMAPALRVDFDPRSISPEHGLAFITSVGHTQTWIYRLGSDSSDRPQASSLTLLEDGKPLGPAHAQHVEIRENGNGRFSHWGDVVIFSSSDGTDPRTNGRRYRAVATLAPRRWWIVAAGVPAIHLAAMVMLLLWRARETALLRAGSALRRVPALDRAVREGETLLMVAAGCFAVAVVIGILGLRAPVVTFTLPPGDIAHELGVAYIVSVPSRGLLYHVRGGGPYEPFDSTTQLYEDGRPLGPGRSVHDDIRKIGQGRFSHWQTAIQFSASDNSDPRRNGRQYSARAASTLASVWVVVAFSALGAGLVSLGGWVRSSSMRYARLRRAVIAPVSWLHAPPRLRPRIAAALVALMGVCGASAVALAWSMGGTTQIGLELGRFFPLSDADGYHNCATLLGAWGSLDWDYCGRRMLYISMLSSLLVTLGWSSQNALIAQGFLVGLATAVLVLQVARVTSRAAAVVLLIAASAFAWQFTVGVFMTEVAGYVMGALSLALLLAFSVSRRSPWLFAGMAFLGIGMVARAGALSCIPAAVLWATVLGWRESRRTGAKYLAVALAGAAIGPLLQFAEVRLVGLDPANSGGNFSTVLYGLSTGSRSFQEAHDTFREVFATQGESAAFKVVYEAAIRNILAHPAVFVGSLQVTWLNFWGEFFAIDVLMPWRGIVTAAFVGGVLRCLIVFRSVAAASLLLVLLLGEFVVAPLIGGSNSVRVFATTVMVRWTICTFGIDWVMGGIGRLLKASPRFVLAPATGNTVAAIGGVVGLAVVGLMIFPMLPLYPRLERFPLTSRCGAGFEEVISRVGDEAIMMTITNRDNFESATPFRIGLKRLRDDLTYRVTWYAPDIKNLKPPVTFLRAVDLADGRINRVWHLAYTGELPFRDEPQSLCVDLSRRMTIAAADNFVIRDIQPISTAPP
jgi:hypothetical protein